MRARASSTVASGTTTLAAEEPQRVADHRRPPTPVVWLIGSWRHSQALVGEGGHEQAERHRTRVC